MNNKDFDHHIDSTNLQEQVGSLQKDAKQKHQEIKELQDKNDTLVQKLNVAQQEINKQIDSLKQQKNDIEQMDLMAHEKEESLLKEVEEMQDYINQLNN